MQWNAPFRLIFEHQVPIGLFHAHGQAVAGDAGVVDQHVDAALILARVLANASLMDSGEVTSRFTVIASPLQARISSATSSFFSISGEATTMSNPARQSVSDYRPADPRLAPVTKATRLNIQSP